MSISTATDRLAPRRDPKPSRTVLVSLLAAIVLVSAIVALAVSSTASSTGRVAPRPAVSGAKPAPSVLSPASASASRGGFRDPVTHALLRRDTAHRLWRRCDNRDRPGARTGSPLVNRPPCRSQRRNQEGPGPALLEEGLSWGRPARAPASQARWPRYSDASADPASAMPRRSPFAS